jgi:hypothetical protein
VIGCTVGDPHGTAINGEKLTQSQLNIIKETHFYIEESFIRMPEINPTE